MSSCSRRELATGCATHLHFSPRDIHPLTILSTRPSAGIGALAILMLFGFDFSLIAIVLLIGIVQKNAIMMVAFRDHGRARRTSAPKRRSARPRSYGFARS